MSFLRRREISIVIYVLSAFITLFAEYTGYGLGVSANLMIAVTMIVNFTLVIGFYNLFYHHVNIIRKLRMPDLFYSLVLVVTFLGYLAVMYTWPAAFDWTLDMLFAPLMLGVSLLGLYLIPMLYRGARMRNWISFVIVICAIIVALQQSAIGMLVPPLQGLGSWLLAVPNTGARRAYLIMAGVGAIVLLIRGLMGLERSYLGEV